MRKPQGLRRWLVAPLALTASLTFVLTACGGGGGDNNAGGGETVGATDKVAVTLITKDSTNPFWIAMQNGAKASAAKQQNVSITIAAGKKDGDEDGQVQAIEQSIARGDQGILITPNGPGVNPAIKKAREAGLFVIALDTPPDPADTVDITFATNNREAGQLIGKWTAAELGGKKAVIAMLDAFNDKIITVDVNRDQGFLEGMGIDVADGTTKGDEAKTGSYTGGKGGDYTIVCNEPSGANVDGGKTAMETCLTKNPDINVVYSINEPAGEGASKALKAANNDAIVVSVDGGCQGVDDVKQGIFGATAQQYPVKMAELGVDAIVKIARGGEKPVPSDGLDFFSTGVELVTDKPVDGLKSITTTESEKVCWGTKS
ncbi:substrate-binding domain-containing protein [uncultured Friedmanniella sp.]|uniref:substrate-binding domain-containing protein n=1 Tax=uncultured Friedmanniella sp. TaxID=335381 RepID=UPI0035CCA145